MGNNTGQSALRFASALSTVSETGEAVQQVCTEALESLGGVPDLALLFVSATHCDELAEQAARVCDLLGTTRVLGVTAESIVSGATEVEMQPALSLWLARLPGVTLQAMHLDWLRTPEGGSFVGWPDDLPAQWPEQSALLVLGDPFSFPADGLLELLNAEQPNIPIVGGMASAGHQPGENRLLLGDQVYQQGAVALLLHGEVRIRHVVSQGCRPIGQHFVVTKAEQNVIYELGGQPAYARLEEVFRSLPTRDQQLLQKGVHLGRVVSEYQDQFEQGDFLVRNLVGVDQERGAIAIGDYVRPGQTVQFHLRDAETADAELRQLLARAKQQAAMPYRGGLLFTCNGRGTRLFSEPHHDAQAVHQACGGLPLAGFFAAGELGPIGGQNFLHGFTASIALFE